MSACNHFFPPKDDDMDFLAPVPIIDSDDFKAASSVYREDLLHIEIFRTIFEMACESFEIQKAQNKLDEEKIEYPALPSYLSLITMKNTFDSLKKELDNDFKTRPPILQSLSNEQYLQARCTDLQRRQQGFRQYLVNLGDVKGVEHDRSNFTLGIMS